MYGVEGLLCLDDMVQEWMVVLIRVVFQYTKKSTDTSEMSKGSELGDAAKERETGRRMEQRTIGWMQQGIM